MDDVEIALVLVALVLAGVEIVLVVRTHFPAFLFSPTTTFHLTKHPELLCSSLTISIIIKENTNS
jgi:hypothetical protein